jgi:MFS family permease
MMALPLALATRIGSPGRTGSIVGLLGSVSAVGTALGPSAGGVLLATLGWPSVFAGLAATAAVVFLAGALRLPPDAPSTGTAAELDPAGTLLLALALAGYALAMTLGGTLSGPAVATLAGLSVAAFTAFAFAEARASDPLIRIDVLRDRALDVGLLSVALVSTVVMATLVVGPFYLVQGLGLDPARTGLVMSVGPAIAALAGVPAGRLVDRAGAFPVSMLGLAGVALGSVLMVILPGVLGLIGYLTALAAITSGYALFQAANATAVMARSGANGRGLIAALLSLSRNLGLITGASAMGKLFALGTGGATLLHLPPGGESGLQLTFAAAAALAGLALFATWWGQVRDRSTRPDTPQSLTQGEVK